MSICPSIHIACPFLNQSSLTPFYTNPPASTLTLPSTTLPLYPNFSLLPNLPKSLQLCYFSITALSSYYPPVPLLYAHITPLSTPFSSFLSYLSQSPPFKLYIHQSSCTSIHQLSCPFSQPITPLPFTHQPSLPLSYHQLATSCPHPPTRTISTGVKGGG